MPVPSWARAPNSSTDASSSPYSYSATTDNGGYQPSEAAMDNSALNSYYSSITNQPTTSTANSYAQSPNTSTTNPPSSTGYQPSPAAMNYSVYSDDANPGTSINGGTSNNHDNGKKLPKMLCVGAAIVVTLGILVSAIVVYILDDQNNANSSQNTGPTADETATEDPLLIVFGSIGLGLLQYPIPSLTIGIPQRVLCITAPRTEDYNKPYSLQDCATADNTDLLERQVFYYDPEQQQIVLNAVLSDYSRDCFQPSTSTGASPFLFPEYCPDTLTANGTARALWLPPGSDNEEGQIRLQFINDKNIRQRKLQQQQQQQQQEQEQEQESICLTTLTAGAFQTFQSGDDGGYSLWFETCDSSKAERQQFVAPDHFWDPPPPAQWEVRPVEPNVTGTLQSVTGDGCVTWDTNSATVLLKECRDADNQLFRFNDYTLQMEMPLQGEEVSDECMEREEDAGGSVQIRQCQSSTTAISNSGSSGVTKSSSEEPTTTPTRAERQQWYYDREGRLYHFPNRVNTPSFCLGARGTGSSSLRSRQRRELRPMGGGGGGSSSGGSFGSGGSYGTGSSNSGGSYSGGTSNVGSGSTSSGSTSSGGSLTSTGGSSGLGGSNGGASTSGFPASFGSSGIPSGSSFGGAFRPSHPTYAARPPSFLVTRHPSRRPSRRPTPQPSAVPQQLYMDECLSLYDYDKGYNRQRFTFMPLGAFRNGTGVIELEYHKLCLTVTDLVLLDWLLEAKPCNSGPDQVFQYHNDTGFIEGTGEWENYCMEGKFPDSSTNSKRVTMSRCSTSANSQVLMKWHQDSKGRLVNYNCLDWNTFEGVLEQTECEEDGDRQKIHWTPADFYASSAPSIMPSQIVPPTSAPASANVSSVDEGSSTTPTPTTVPSSSLGSDGTGNIFERPSTANPTTTAPPTMAITTASEDSNNGNSTANNGTLASETTVDDSNNGDDNNSTNDDILLDPDDDTFVENATIP